MFITYDAFTVLTKRENPEGSLFTVLYSIRPTQEVSAVNSFHGLDVFQVKCQSD